MFITFNSELAWNLDTFSLAESCGGLEVTNTRIEFGDTQNRSMKETQGDLVSGDLLETESGPNERLSESGHLWLP